MRNGLAEIKAEENKMKSDNFVTSELICETVNFHAQNARRYYSSSAFRLSRIVTREVRQ